MEKPHLIAFEVTRRCRFNCQHCRANAQQSGAGGELTTEQCKRILASIAQFSKSMIILTGGEPLERGDIYDLIRYGRDLGLRMVMATCGYTITDESIANLKEAGLSALSISLDGASAGTHDTFRQTKGAFDSAVKAAKSAHRGGIRFQINTAITKSNLREIPAIAKLAQELGAYCFNPFILVPTGRGEKIASEVLEPAEYEKLLRDLLQLKEKSAIEMRVTCGPQFARVCRQAKLASSQRPQIIVNRQSSIVNSVSGCMGGRGFGFISYKGDVQTCGFLNVSAGNLVENGFNFEKIWVESQFLKEIRDLSAYRGNCGICEYVGICGGCRARAYSMTGDYLAADPICNFNPGGKSPRAFLLASAPTSVFRQEDVGASQGSRRKQERGRLTKLQKQLCNALQNGLPICERPFAEIAKDLNISEEEILEQTRELKNAGIVRRIGAVINYRALGMTSTLVAAHIPQEKIQEVADAVNSLESVSHNYLRTHYYNLWFTLQGQTDEQIDFVLAGLSSRFGIDFHSLPTERVFELDVRFDAVSDSDLSLEDVEGIPKSEVVELDENQRIILSKLQGDLDVTAEPFAFLCSNGLETADVVRIITELINEGIIRRIAGIVDHRKLGFVANVLFAGEVSQSRVIGVGKRLARFRMVSHCYQRKTFEGWPYNLFAMMHSRNISRIQRVINKFTKAEGIESFQLLPTTAELKKQPVKHKFKAERL